MLSAATAGCSSRHRRLPRPSPDELGKTVEALAAKADVTAQAEERAAALKDQAEEKADRAATAARANRTPLLLVAAAVVVLRLVRLSRGRRR
ncbi:DUF3618 domain-containing protein [Streptomyces sp. NPDC051582]|uniref:DUF3618 domain-containing protein n=1 Tax=Streptomyces sp. NPDC051582 TaxID=3155167 RepID=UPI0034406730